jgi:enoyl-CoA hydratase
VTASAAGPDYETLLVDLEGPVATVRINRPDKLNALNAGVRREITRAMDELGADPAIRVAILCGTGEKAFVAGADVSEFAARTPGEQREVYQRRRVYDAVATFPKPLIAAIHGFCLGGGVELALACDVRVADPSARFGQFEIRLGLIPGAGGTQRLARLVGPGQAARIALSGDVIDATEAHRIGLVEILADEGEHLERARELAGRMARWSPVALGLVKESLRAAAETSLAAGLELEKELFLAAFASNDGREGVRAFVEKRRPEFRGR